MHRSVLVFVLTIGAGVPYAGRAVAAWVVTEVPMLSHWTGGVEVADINSSGVVCGSGNYVSNASATAFRYDGVTVTELPHLTPGDPISIAKAINADGLVCGHSHRPDGWERAVYWVDSALFTIPYAVDADTTSWCQATDISDSGIITGMYWDLNGQRAAFYFQDGVTYSLNAVIRAAGLLGVQSANAVNNRDLICGVADNAAGVTNVWTYDVHTGTLTVLGTIGTDDCSAVDINNLGETIGRGKQTSGDIYRAVHFDGAWHLVDPLIGITQWGEGINDHGRMVGHAGSSASKYSWYSDGPGAGSARTLNLPGWSRVTVQAINNNDWIVGYGRTATSGTDNRGFIIAALPGDADHDGDVDLTDCAAFVECLSGPQAAAGFVAPSGACLATFDFAPADGDVDLQDFAALQTVFLAE